LREQLLGDDDFTRDPHADDGRLTGAFLAVYGRDMFASDHLMDRSAIGSVEGRDK
jgi:hypothetical protein